MNLKKAEYYSEALPPISTGRVNLVCNGPSSLPEIRQRKINKKRNAKKNLRMNNNNDYQDDSQN